MFFNRPSQNSIYSSRSFQQLPHCRHARADSNLGNLIWPWLPISSGNNRGKRKTPHPPETVLLLVVELPWQKPNLQDLAKLPSNHQLSKADLGLLFSELVFVTVGRGELKSGKAEWLRGSCIFPLTCLQATALGADTTGRQRLWAARRWKLLIKERFVFPPLTVAAPCWGIH